MELQIFNPKGDTNVTPVEWNYEELKTEIQQKTKLYEMMVYDSDQIKKAKADRASLNTFSKSLNDERIRLKRVYLEPYTAFEAQIKELTVMVDSASASIDKQVKAYEEEERQKKLAKAKEMFEEFANDSELGDFLTYEKVEIPQWGNASYSNAKTVKDIEDIIAKTKSDLEAIQSMKSEFEFDMLTRYKKSLDLGEALKYGREAEDQAKAKAEYEARRAEQEALKAEREAQAEANRANFAVTKQEEPQKPVESVQEPSRPPTTPKEYTVTFSVTGTADELTELSRFLRGNGYRFEQLKG